MLHFLRYTTLFWLAGFAVSCATTPESDRRQFIIVPDSQMQALGVQAFAEISASEKPSDNVKMTREVEQIGQQIAAASGYDFEWEFKLFANDMVNAFCLPGGKVGIFTGILPVAQTNAGLAAIMGHEVAHATLRHGAERMSQALASQVGLTLAGLSLSDSRYRGAILAALGIGMQVGLALPYSRLHEQEADEIGLRYMARAGYDPREAVGLWERMAALGSAAPPEFLSTHPNPESRIRNLQKQMPEAIAIYEASAQRRATQKLAL